MVLFVNAAAEQLCNVSRSAMVGRVIYDVIQMDRSYRQRMNDAATSALFAHRAEITLGGRKSVFVDMQMVPYGHSGHRILALVPSQREAELMGGAIGRSGRAAGAVVGDFRGGRFPLVRARAVNGERTRAFLEAVLWVAVTRQPWGRLPRMWGPWHSVYVRFTRWAQDGIWDEVIASLHAHADIADPLQRLVATYLDSRHPASVARREGPRFTPF